MNIILPSTPCSSKLSLTYRLLHQNLVCISVLPHMCPITSPSHRPWFHQFSIWWGTQIMKLHFTQLPTGWRYCLPLRNKFQSHVSKSEALRNTHVGGPPLVDSIFSIFVATVLMSLPFLHTQLAISAIQCCQEISKKKKGRLLIINIRAYSYYGLLGYDTVQSGSVK